MTKEECWKDIEKDTKAFTKYQIWEILGANIVGNGN